MARVAWAVLLFALIAWANFIVSAVLTGEPDLLAWSAATLVSLMAVVLAGVSPQVAGPCCVECGRPLVPAPFCLGCGRVPKQAGGRRA